LTHQNRSSFGLEHANKSFTPTGSFLLRFHAVQSGLVKSVSIRKRAMGGGGRIRMGCMAWTYA